MHTVFLHASLSCCFKRTLPVCHWLTECWFKDKKLNRPLIISAVSSQTKGPCKWDVTLAAGITVVRDCGHSANLLHSLYIVPRIEISQQCIIRMWVTDYNKGFFSPTATLPLSLSRVRCGKLRDNNDWMEQLLRYVNEAAQRGAWRKLQVHVPFLIYESI